MEIHVAKKYRVDFKIGYGSFGDVYKGTDITTGEDVAIKVARSTCSNWQMRYEAKIMEVMSREVGFSRLKWYGTEGDCNIIVMNLLGSNLRRLFKACDYKFTLKTVLLLADQMISRIESLHSRNYLHGDIKPNNFLIGCVHGATLLHLIDFGLARRYRDLNGVHVKNLHQRSGGTGHLYSSIRTHRGVETTRRDDLESLGYTLMYFIAGSLPWQDLTASSKVGKYERMREKKMSTSIEALCGNFPVEFSDFMTYCRKLKFDEEPDYSYLRHLFRTLFRHRGFAMDGTFDWDTLPLCKRVNKRYVAYLQTPKPENPIILPPTRQAFASQKW